MTNTRAVINSSQKLVLFGITAATVVACAGQPTSRTSPERRIEARDTLLADLRKCSSQHGYDPKAPGLPEKELAPQELKWRQCFYDAIRVYARNNPAMAATYEKFIADDMAMTTQVQQGAMTRSQRRGRIEQQIAQIKAAEDKQIKAEMLERERRLQELITELSTSGI